MCAALKNKSCHSGTRWLDNAKCFNRMPLSIEHGQRDTHFSPTMNFIFSKHPKNLCLCISMCFLLLLLFVLLLLLWLLLFSQFSNCSWKKSPCFWYPLEETVENYTWNMAQKPVKTLPKQPRTIMDIIECDDKETKQFLIASKWRKKTWINLGTSDGELSSTQFNSHTL